MNIAVFPNLLKKDAAFYAERVVEVLSSLMAETVLPIETKKFFPQLSALFKPEEQMLPKCDIAIAIGGDGTIIRCAKEAARFGKPVLGINVGRLGFVAGLETDELDHLPDLISGNYTIEERMMLEVTLSGPQKEETYFALNDAVVARGTLSRILDLQVLLNDTILCGYRADGLILSTPTGSTAYSLSAGGPVIDPGMRCILLSPICPHSLLTRPVVFGEDSCLRVQILSDSASQESYLTVDGSVSIPLSPNVSSVTFRKAETPARLIKIKNLNFYEVVNSKLAERRL